jgi:hypothetical protein
MGLAYRDRALAILNDAMQAVPAPDRGRFWNEQVGKDGVFRPLKSHPGFARLQQRFADGRTTTSR